METSNWDCDYCDIPPVRPFAIPWACAMAISGVDGDAAIVRAALVANDRTVWRIILTNGSQLLQSRSRSRLFNWKDTVYLGNATSDMSQISPSFTADYRTAVVGPTAAPISRDHVISRSARLLRIGRRCKDTLNATPSIQSKMIGPFTTLNGISGRGSALEWPEDCYSVACSECPYAEAATVTGNVVLRFWRRTSAAAIQPRPFKPREWHQLPYLLGRQYLL